MTGARWLAVLLVAGSAAMALAGHPIGRDQPRLEIGMAPFLPARTLIANYQPMRVFLEHELEETVEIATATDYRTFHARVERREYPLVITVANSAYLAWRDSGYVPLLKPQNFTYPVLVTTQKRALSGLAELRGKSLALPDALAIISMQAMRVINEAGLRPGEDLRLVHLPTHSAAVNHVLADEVAAAIVSNRALQQMSQEVRDRVRVVQSWEQMSVPGVVYLASPRLSRERRAQLTDAILGFAHSPKGRTLMRAWGYGDLVAASARDLEPLALYGDMLRAAMAETPSESGTALKSPAK